MTASIHVDSTSELPDGYSTEIGGVLWLARMATKAQLSQDHLLKADTAYPCKRDTELLEKIYPDKGNVFAKSIVQKAQDFQAIVIQSNSYNDVWSKLKQTCSPAVIANLNAVRFASMNRKKKHGKDE